MSQASFADDLPTKKLTFQDCVRLALAKNEDYLVEKKNVELKDFALKQKWAAFLPTLSGFMSYSQGYPNNNVPVTSQGWGDGVNLSYNLFDGFTDIKGYRKGRLDYASEQNNLKKTMAATIYSVKQAYENLRAQQDLINVSQGILKLLKDNERLVLLRFQSGRENKGSYLDAQADSAKAELDFYKSKIDRRNMVNALADVMNDESGQDFYVTDDIPSMRAPPIIVPNMEKDHPDYVDVLFKQENANLDEDISKLKFLPKLDLAAGVGINADTFAPQGDKNWSVSVTLSIPLFSGGSDYFVVLASKTALAISEINLHKKVIDIRNNLQSTYDGLEIAKRSYDIAVKKLESMKIREKLARDRYNIGVLTYDAWNEIVKDLVGAETAVISAKKEKVMSEANWISAQGRGDLE